MPPVASTPPRPPSDHGGRRRSKPSASPDRDHVQSSIGKQSDSRVLRGAEIIRQQMKKQDSRLDTCTTYSFKQNTEAIKRDLRSEEVERRGSHSSRGRENQPNIKEDEQKDDSSVVSCSESDVPQPPRGTSFLDQEDSEVEQDSAEFALRRPDLSDDDLDPPTVPPRGPLSPHFKDFDDSMESPRTLIDELEPPSRSSPKRNLKESIPSFGALSNLWPSRNRKQKTQLPAPPPPPPPPEDSDEDDSPHTDTVRDRKSGPKFNEYSAQSMPTYDFIEDDYDDLLELNEDEYESLSPSKSMFRRKGNKPLKSKKLNLTLTQVPEDAHLNPHFAADMENRQGPPPVTASPPREARKHETSLLLSRQRQYGPSLPDLPSPLSIEYTMLLEDPAYLHAQKAGHLWQSLVGQHVRFPSRWWNGARSPPLGDLDSGHKWEYCGRYRVKANPFLNKAVRHRGSPGRILLHVVVQDLITHRPVQDVAVGCFHPSARGIRRVEEANPKYDDTRDLWMAARKRSSDAVSVVDRALAGGHVLDARQTKSPLGSKTSVTNHNMRAVFGEKPPLETIFVPEGELFERLSSTAKSGVSPAMVLLQEFVIV